MKLKRLYELRVDRDIKQVDIARFLNITQSAYAHYELGTRSISIEILIKLCKFYKVSADYILELK